MYRSTVKTSCQGSNKESTYCIDGCMEYYIHESVDKCVPATGAGVDSLVFTGSWRLMDICSTLQTKLITISKALEHSLNYGTGAAVIHTDSKSALCAILRENMNENSPMKSSTVACLEIQKEQKDPIVFNWLPSHTGIPGKEQTDKLASENLRSNKVAIKVQKSLNQLKSKANNIKEQVMQNITNFGQTCLRNMPHGNDWLHKI